MILFVVVPMIMIRTSLFYFFTFVTKDQICDDKMLWKKSLKILFETAMDFLVLQRKIMLTFSVHFNLGKLRRRMVIYGKLTFRIRASYIQDGRTATLQMLHFIYCFSANISTEYFKHAAHSPFFPSKCHLFHNATFFWFMYYSHFTYRMC